MSTPSLAQQVLKTIASALPSSLADKVITAQVEQVFVWVLKDNTSASSLIAFLQDNGFKNIKVDSKGNTITAQSGSLINNKTQATSNTEVITPCSNFSGAACL